MKRIPFTDPYHTALNYLKRKYGEVYGSYRTPVKPKDQEIALLLSQYQYGWGIKKELMYALRRIDVITVTTFNKYMNAST